MSISTTNAAQSAQAQQQAQEQAAQQRYEQEQDDRAQDLTQIHQAAADQREIHGRNILHANQENRSQSADLNGNPQPLPGDSINLQYYA